MQQKYVGQVVAKNGGFTGLVLEVKWTTPNYEVYKQYETDDENMAQQWVDDELEKLATGKGIWD